MSPGVMAYSVIGGWITVHCPACSGMRADRLGSGSFVKRGVGAGVGDGMGVGAGQADGDEEGVGDGDRQAAARVISRTAAAAGRSGTRRRARMGGRG